MKKLRRYDDIDICNAIIDKLFRLTGINGITVNETEIINTKPLIVHTYKSNTTKESENVYLIEKEVKQNTIK